MNLTSSKAFRICLCWVLLIAFCIGMMFVSKPEQGPSIYDADQVCVSGALYESWMYVITDKAFIEQTTVILSNLEYEKSKDYVNMMEPQEVLCFTYSKGSELIQKYIVDKNGMLCFEAGGQSYKITSEFDFDELYNLLKPYLNK